MAGSRLGTSWRTAGSVLSQPQLRRAELAFAWAFTGEWALTVALAVVAFEDNGATGVGLVAVLRLVPSAVGTPFITAVADRARRERTLAAVSILRGLTIGAAALLLALDVQRIAFYGLIVIATVAFTVFRPAHSALLPLLCKTTAELTSATVVRGLVEGLAMLAGPVLAGALLAWSGPAAVFAAAAALSLLAAVLLLRIRYDAPIWTAPPERPRLVREIVDGLRVVARHRDLRWVFNVGFVQTYTRGALNVFTVVMAFELLDLGESGVAGLSAAVGVGGIVGSLLVTLLVGSRHLGRWLVLAAVLWGAPIAVIGAVPRVGVAYALVAVVGVANAVIDVPIFTLPVRLVRDDVLTRVFGLFESTVTVGLALGSALTPVAIELFGLESAMIATGLLLPLLAAAGWRPMEALDARLTVRDTEIGVLRATPMLQLLPVPSIEYLASHAHMRRVPAGTTVFRQGDPGDHFFVIAAGTADVIGDGAPIRTEGPGECFGEVALLRDLPRTATVRAGDELVVVEIPGDDFLEVVSGHGSTNEAAHAVAATHLANFHTANVGI